MFRRRRRKRKKTDDLESSLSCALSLSRGHENSGTDCEKFRFLRWNATLRGVISGDRSRVYGGNVPMGLGEICFFFEGKFSGKLAKHGNFHALVAFMIILLFSCAVWPSNEAPLGALATALSSPGKTPKRKSCCCRHNNGGKYRSNFFAAPRRLLLLHPRLRAPRPSSGNTFSQNPEFPETKNHALTKTQEKPKISQKRQKFHFLPATLKPTSYQWPPSRTDYRKKHPCPCSGEPFSFRGHCSE